MNEKHLDDCALPNIQQNEILDPPVGYCNTSENTLKDVGDDVFGDKGQRTGFGHENNCDPMQAGRIVDDKRFPPNRGYIYKYNKALYGTHEAVRELFNSLVVLDVNGNAVPVPIIWGSQERAVAAIIQSNVRQDNSLVINRIKLPMLALYSSGFDPNKDRYLYHNALSYMRELRSDGKPGKTINARHNRDTVFGMARGIPIDISYQLTAWTMYQEDMDQLFEQIVLKFSPVAYIRVQGVNTWETTVKLDGIANNLDTEIGDRAMRVIKFQFNLTAETFIPQPIVRKSAVLKTKIDMVDAVTDEEITAVLSRLEQAAEGFE